MNKDSKMNNEEENDEYNKQILKQTALTFTREGISNDLKYFIQKKITHNKTNLSYLTQLIDITVNGNSDEMIQITFGDKSPLRQLLDHICIEIMKTDVLLDKAINFVIEKDLTLKSLKG
jgi:hypothetical protein